MRRFAYWRDPLFLVSCGLYALNRWVVKPRVHNPFLLFHFNDLLLIPCALPLLLWLHARLGWRSRDQAPTVAETAFHLLVWSVLFEWIGPRIIARATGDPWDVVAYVAGGLLATLWWNRRRTSLEAAGEAVAGTPMT